MDFYSQNAPALIRQYNQLDPAQVHSTWLENLPAQPGRALDIGAGSGRDAVWLAEQGWQVTAVEPCKELREQILSELNLIVLNDKLPKLPATPNGPYQLILVSAVWMHLNQKEQAEALNRLKSMLAENGTLIITWRNQVDETERKFELVDETLFKNAEIITSNDKGDREGVMWQCAIIKNKEAAQ